MAASGWEFFDHTADIGIRAWGPDLASVLTHAAHALMHLLTGGSCVPGGRAPVVVDISAVNREELVVTWLQELLVRFELEQLVFDACEFHELTDQRLRASVSARRCDPAAERLGREVKAITYHQLHVVQTAGQYQLEIIVDV